MNEFVEQFLVEARELVAQATDDLLALEQAPDDHGRLDSAFRSFHTLKGSAGIIEFAAMARAMHAAEDLLAAVKGGDHPVTADLIGGCLACLDQTVRWLEAVEAAGEPPADTDADANAAATRLVARLSSSSAGPARVDLVAGSAAEGRPSWVERLIAEASAAANATMALRYTPDADSFFRGEDPIALIARLPGLLALAVRPRQPWPPLEEFEPFACNLIIDALASGSLQDATDCLHSVKDQVQIYAVIEPDRTSGSSFPERVAEILQAQLALLSEPASEGFAGRLGSAGRVAGNVLRHLGMEDKAVAIDKASAESLAAADASALRIALEAILTAAAAPSERKSAGGSAFAAPGPQAAATRALRVDVERIEAIVKLTGELTVVKNALGHAAGLAQEATDPRGLAQTLKQQHALLDRLTAELQRSVLAIRVLPLGHVFRRFQRPLREMARTMGKTVRLALEGEATEADKAVVEALFEPLLHLIRNAVDHGVEAGQQRVSAGKPERAVIRLRGERAGEHVIIEVADDGRGIDVSEVRRVAEERGLAAADALAALSDEEALELIFTSGFSTASAVTSISGRGVGMDAVRSAIERLGGRVALQSRAGEGTTVRLIVPFTVMMTRVMTVESAGQVFGVPFEAMVETLQLARDRIVPIGMAEAFELRGRTVPLVRLARALGFDADDRASPVANVVVVEAGGQLGALEVDRFGERLDVMLKPMDGLLSGMTAVAGTTLLGDGRVLIVLDLQELLQ